MYVVLRFVSLVLIVLALMLLGADVLTSLEKGGEITVRSLDQVWIIIDRASNIAFKAWLQRSLPAPFAGWVDVLLSFWGWAVLGLPGIVLAFLFGRRTADV